MTIIRWESVAENFYWIIVLATIAVFLIISYLIQKKFAKANRSKTKRRGKGSQ